MSILYGMNATVYYKSFVIGWLNKIVYKANAGYVVFDNIDSNTIYDQMGPGADMEGFTIEVPNKYILINVAFIYEGIVLKREDISMGERITFICETRLNI